MIARARAIVLRVFPYSNTSRVVSWLTADHGRVATLIKGSQRPKSLFLGQYDLFYTCELLFYRHERDGLHIARECTPLTRRDRLRQDWAATAVASYLADLAFRTAPPGAAQPALFATLESSLDRLAAGEPAAGVLLGHELDWLQALGLAPRLAHCVRCGRAVAEDDPVPLFSVPRGGCICLECQPEAGIETMATDPPVMRLLRTGRSGPSAVSAIPAVWDAAARLLGSFLNYHLDLPLASRPIALNILAR